MSVRKSSHGTIFLIVSSGSPRALIASSLRSTSKKPFCPMTRSLHPPMTACGHRVRFVATWREEFFEVPNRMNLVALTIHEGEWQPLKCQPIEDFIEKTSYRGVYLLKVDPLGRSRLHCRTSVSVLRSGEARQPGTVRVFSDQPSRGSWSS